jgi:hypothetical protein
VPDSLLEGDGFEPSVPRPRRALLSGPLPLVAAKGRRRRSRHCGSARFLLLGKPFHRAGGVYGFGGLRFVALLGGFCVPAVQLKYTFTVHRLDQQFAERPYQGINAVRRIPRCGAVDITVQENTLLVTGKAQKEDENGGGYLPTTFMWSARR